LVRSSLSEVWQFKFACVLRFRRSALQSTSCPALEVAFCCACLWGGACFFASPPFSGAGSVICQLPPCCQCVMMVHCLFFNFVGQFGFGCCSLAQEMSSVICYLPCFREWLITCPLLIFQCLFTAAEISSLLLPLSPVHFQ
jgi:hypothetical protein